MRCLLPALVICCALCPAAPAEEPIRVRPGAWAQPLLGVKTGNFFKVSDEVYRSEQPDEDNLGELKRLGIRSILSLRHYHSDEGEIRDPGMRLYRVKMDAGHIVDAEIREAVGILVSCSKPVLVHCWHGSDRTGAVIAAYRMLVMKWERDAAIDEFVNGGFGYHDNWYPHIVDYLRQMAIP